MTQGPILLLVLLAGVVMASAGPSEWFVGPGGSDENPGTADRPFATPERARDAVRKQKADGGIPEGGVTVWLQGGDYPRTAAFDLGPADSGSATSPIVWRSVNDARVRWLGGIEARGWTPVTDPTVLARLDPAARDAVLQASLKSLGRSHLGSLSSRGFSRPTTPAHSELFFEHRPMTLARWPNEGTFERIAGFPADSGLGDDHGGKIGRLEGGFLYSGDRPRRWQDLRNVWVHGYWAWDWANSYERVESLDPESRRIRTAAPHGLYGFRAGQRFHFLNVLEELDQPGEWFLDAGSDRIFFWPPQPIAGREVLVSVLGEPLVRLQDTSHITVQGIEFEASRANGIEIRGGVSNRIVGCRLRNLGNWGAVLDGGRGHSVTSCDVIDTGDGGINVSGGDRQTLSPGGHVVANTHFQRQGRWSKCYVPAVLLSGVGHRVAHNRIHDHPHCAILFTGNDHLIEFNDIHHIALETGDVGAIYTGRDYSFRGNRIRSNYIHETGGVGMGSMGVYMDDCVSGTEVSGNVFYRVHWAMFIGGGRDHRVEHNLFVDCDPAIRLDARGLDPAPVWRGMVDNFMRTQLTAVPAPLYRERYPELVSLDRWYGAPGQPARTGDAFQGIPPEGNRVTRNVCFGKWLEAGWRATESDVEMRDNVVIPDLTAAPRPPDFALPAASPAFQHGFQTPAMSRIGPQPDPDRQRLARFP